MKRRAGRTHLRLKSLAAYWWQAVSSGRFFTRWVLLGSGITAVLILSPVSGLASFPEHASAMAASLIAWAVMVVCILPVAYAERRVRRRGVRGALVITVLFAASFARPFLNDLIASTLFDHQVTGGWGQRVLTNALTWFALLPLIAGAVTWYADSRRSASRLSAALAVFDDLRHRINSYGAQNSAVLAEEIAQLRVRRDELLSSHVDFDAVREFAEQVRASSHRLDERLQVALDYRSGYAVEGSRTAVRSTPWLARLAPPPPLLVAALYFVASLPYTFVAGGRGLVALALALLLVLSAGVHFATRYISRGQSPVVRGAVIVAAWTIVGLIMTAAGMATGAGDGIVLAVPLLVIPALAVVIGFGVDALRRTRDDGRALTRLLARTSTLVTARTALAREPLWRAVDLLHDRVQSRCVIFAARADEREPTPEEAELFRQQTDEAFDAILEGATPNAEQYDLDGLLATWAGVLEVDAEIDAPAMIALQSPDVSARVVAAVGEGLINAVKHSAARSAQLTVTTASDGSALTVVIVSAGALGTGAAGLGLASLGGRARLTQVGDDVVLEVTVPLSGEAVGGSAPSRRWNPPTSTVRVR
jgi:hypothetical protein